MGKFEEDISEALSSLKNQCDQGTGDRCVKRSVDIKELKMIILSDQHKGQQDGADDFQKCKEAYHAALGYYLSAGFDLCLLGDVEELWECHPTKVIKAYQDTFELEQQFAEKDRYLRIHGNHDDLWQYQDKVDQHLKKYIARADQPAKVLQALLLSVHSGGQKLGEIFLVHGHQGTGASDKYSWLSRVVVRYVWRNFQRLTRIRLSTPGNDYKLRSDHCKALFKWANEQHALMLIAGHTHYPVFLSQSHVDYLNSQLSELQQKLASATSSNEKQKIQEEIHYKHAELRWVSARSPGGSIATETNAKPCYFNTGCCSFADGDITGIELDQGRIRLVRWPDDFGNPKKKILREADLKSELKKC